MKILFLGDCKSWHNALWLKYFCENEENEVFLFSDDEKHKKDVKLPQNVTVIKHAGIFGGLLNQFNINSHLLRKINKAISTGFIRAKINNIIKRYDIDIVHAHSLFYGYLTTEIPMQTPVIFTPLGSSIIIEAQKPGYYQKMARAAYERADLITTDSIILQQKGINIGAPLQKSTIIQNGVDRTLFYPFKSRLREVHEIADDEVVLFSPRAIDPLYNIDCILESLAILKKTNIKFKCMFTFAFGDHNYDTLIELARQLKIEENIVWLGFKQYSEMPEVYNAADVVLSVPSSDSSPKSVYEALCCKKPVVLTRLPWASEILREDIDYLGVDVQNAEQICKAIESLCSSVERRESLASSGFKRAIEHFDYLENMQEMESLMRSLINNKSKN